MYRRGKHKKKSSTKNSPILRMGFRSVEDFKKQNQSSTERKKQYEEIQFKEDGVHGVYDDKLNIHKLHQAIVNKLSQVDEAEIQQLELEKDNLQRKIEKEGIFMTFNDITDISKKLDACDEKITHIKEGKMLKDYLSFSEDILSQYDELMSSNPEKCQNSALSNLIDQYLRFANSDLFNISLVKKPERKGETCSVCKTSLALAIEKDEYRICPTCGSIVRDMISSYHQGSRSDSSDYEEGRSEGTENVKNFRKAILNFDHRADTSHLPSDSQIIETLDAWFEVHEPALCREAVKDNEFDRWIRKGTSVADMETAMKENGYNKWYDNIYHFCKVYWGWRRPKISHLEESLVEDFLNSRASYNLHKGSRSSSMNVNYELYHGLLRYGFDCKFTDFKMVSTRSTLSEYDEIRRKVGADMGWSK